MGDYKPKPKRLYDEDTKSTRLVGRKSSRDKETCPEKKLKAD